MLIYALYLVGFIVSSYYMTQVESGRDKPINTNPSGGRQKPVRPLLPSSPKLIITTSLPEEETVSTTLAEEEPTTPVVAGYAVEKTKTRIRRNYDKTQKYYDKIMNTPSENESVSSGTSEETEELTEIEIQNTDSFLRKAIFNGTDKEEPATKTDALKEKLISMTHSVLSETTGQLDELLSGNNRKRMRRKAKAGGIGGVMVLIAIVVLFIIVKKI